MVDRNFFNVAGPFPLQDLLQVLPNFISCNSNIEIQEAVPLNEATKNDISFFHNTTYLEALKNTKAGAVLLREEYAKHTPKHCIALVSDHPYRDFALITQRFYPEIRYETGIHSSCAIGKNVTIGENVTISAFCTIEDHATIGDNVFIGPHTDIGKNVTIGAKSRIHGSASLHYCIIGENAVIERGVRLGDRGFGFAMSHDRRDDIPHTGLVIIGKNVEIGSNSVIDRGTSENTEIGDFVKIDALVMVGHNVRIKPYVVIAAQSGISGSTTVESHVIMGGQVGISGHLTIGEHAKLGPQSGIIKNVKSGASVMGTPAIKLQDFLRAQIKLRQISKGKSK